MNFSGMIAPSSCILIAVELGQILHEHGQRVVLTRRVLDVF